MVLLSGFSYIFIMLDFCQSGRIFAEKIKVNTGKKTSFPAIT